jgi:Flp pilus assembly protein TadD
MIVTLILTGALLVEAPTSEPYFVKDNIERVDVAYQEMVQGRTDAAIARIRANKRLASDDPAAMINLGAAYARKGMTREALDCYKTAQASRDRFELQLADGSWMDSRRAARIAAAKLEGSAFAVR